MELGKALLFWQSVMFWKFLESGVSLVFFSLLIIISLILFKRIINRKTRNNPLKGESFYIILISIVLALSMIGTLISIWYTVLHYCNF